MKLVKTDFWADIVIVVMVWRQWEPAGTGLARAP
jgi:hypothetical protein